MGNLTREEAPNMAAIEKVLVSGDLRELSPEQRVAYYNRVCESLDLNPLTQPFAYLTLNGKQQLYARKECTEQLRSRRAVSLAIVARELIEGVYVVTARATLPSGRTDESTGAVAVDGLKGEARANACMKAETKAKRRVTLSICGLGMLDETEVTTIPGAIVSEQGPAPQLPAKVAHDPATGEVATNPETFAWALEQNLERCATLEALKEEWKHVLDAQKAARITLEQRAHLMDIKDARKVELTAAAKAPKPDASLDEPGGASWGMGDEDPERAAIQEGR